MSEPRTVLITGTSTGFGRLTAETLARRGHHVIAGLRDVKGRNRTATAELTALAGNEGLSLEVIEIDVTDDASVTRGVHHLLTTTARLDAVINNAGRNFAGPLEAYTAAEAMQQFDVNTLGALRVNNAVIPFLREQGHGALIQVGSLSGWVTPPFNGLYAASKAALASLTEAWHHELAPYGVESVLIEPAAYPTNIGQNAAMPADQERLGLYGATLAAFIGDITKNAAAPGSTAEVSDALADLVELPHGRRPLRTLVAPARQFEAVRAVHEKAAEATRIVAEDMGIDGYLRRARS
ncbi:SDR family NAD(P)-dependent oxidoreductase [Kineosporia succinea]|uniref:NAD(P)-dependent dehydrogenase (Short-subunit alcohol dehydrogenase family) n=1 Tax=Kineosporia succinea TaxID=84632 RepID=A0ABT9PC61_9ACTN|nr:SDR family NAD(P)-dependent oxidoreductase [Kineosporia succinea]MDP9830291.1 NAD(P)-dependent dehydrogenase (short-subunit alcohol dehydrogenase family) [Kineosporia succinea]